MALDLDSLEIRTLYVMDEGWDVSMINCSADGAHVYASISEDMSGRFRVDLLRAYVGFRETWEAMPLSRIVRAATDRAEARRPTALVLAPTRELAEQILEDDPESIAGHAILGLVHHVGQYEPILFGLRDRYESHHRVTITDQALVASANLADRYISDRHLLDKAGTTR